MKHQIFYYEDKQEAAITNILANQRKEAEDRAEALLENTETTEGGCMITPTIRYSKTQFGGLSWPSYRFILCVLEGVSAPSAIVVRHKCHNRLCIHPEHLQFGTQADNHLDDVARYANGVDPDHL